MNKLMWLGAVPLLCAKQFSKTTDSLARASSTGVSPAGPPKTESASARQVSSEIRIRFVCARAGSAGAQLASVTHAARPTKLHGGMARKLTLRGAAASPGVRARGGSRADPGGGGARPCAALNWRARRRLLRRTDSPIPCPANEDSMAQLLIAGCGYVGTALGLCFARDGNVSWGIRRDTSPLPHEIRLFQADLTVPGMLRKLPDETSHVVYLAAPGEATEEAYRGTYVDGLKNLLAAIEKQRLSIERFVFASSTAVYGQRGGEWVDESSPTEPPDFRGQVLLEAEELALASPFRSLVVRFGGIYGPGRTGLIERVRTGERTQGSDPVYRNRIHRDDAVGVLYHALAMGSSEERYLGVDCEPAELRSVERWLAQRMGLPLERAPGAETPDASDTSAHAPGGNKRCRNDRIVAAGYAFRYPTFREGYGELLSEQSVPA